MSNIAKSRSDVKGYISIFNRIIRDSKLTDKEYRVLMILISWYNPELGYSWPSNKRIENEAKVCRKTRLEVIKSLIKKRRIKRKFRTGDTSSFTFPCDPFPENNKRIQDLKKKKPFYRGDEMRKKFGKWYVLAKSGEWLEYADTESKIEWK